MNNYKKRILMINESSFLNTGFSNIGSQILKRLHACGKYEIAELGTYVGPEDPRIASVPWKFYAGQPAANDVAAWAEYNKPSNQWGRMVNLSQFGNWALTNVLLDFKPDFCFGLMDFWMTTPVADNPLRKFYKHIYMPCVDSTPLRAEWIKMMENCDYLVGYSEFALDTINEQSAKIKTAGFKKMLPHPTRPGVELEVFRPMDKTKIREKWKLQKDLPILMTCMRNQGRKLYCELLDSFAKYKKDNPNDPIAKKAVLLIHSSGYDNGQEYWLHTYRLSELDYIPNHYKGLLKDILHTFMCDACGSKHVDYAIKLLNPQMRNGQVYVECPVCQTWAAKAPNTNIGFSREELAEIFNLADLYVQVSVAGADEMPLSEAKACGVPVIAPTFAAMKEKVLQIKPKNADGTPFTMHFGGIPIDIAYYFTDGPTMQQRAYFDKSDLASKLNVLSQPKKLKKLGEEALTSAQENCNYDKIVKRWEYVFDNLVIKDRNTTWDKPLSPSDVGNLQLTLPGNLTDDQFVDWCYLNILKKEVDQVGKQTWTGNLQAGQPREEIVKFFINVAQQDKIAEMILWQYRNMSNTSNVMDGILC